MSRLYFYDTIVFRDFFVVGLWFPCEKFVGGMLMLFNVEILQLTLNTFMRLGIFFMTLKMMGHIMSVSCFAEFYELKI